MLVTLAPKTMRITVADTVAVAATIIAGCRFDLPDTASDGPRSCTASDSSCVCLNPPGVCVECTAADERNCSGTKAQCGADNRCRACRANDECDSGACLETGACAMASQIIYAAPNGSSTAPCGALGSECSITQAIMMLDASHTIIRLAPGAYTVGGTDGVDLGATSGTLIARDAVLTRTTTGPIVSVRNGQSLKLIGGTLRGPNGSDGIRCNTGSKLQVHEAIIEKMNLSGILIDRCNFTVSRSILRYNLRGGISMINVASVATITNNYVYVNGQGISSPVGGMSLKLAPDSKVELNTVVDNYADFGSSTAGGIICEGQGYDAPYNLVYRNQGGTSGMDQVIGTCTFQGSYQLAGMPPDNAPAFENPNDGNNPSYRLTAASPGEVRDRVVAGYTCQNLTDFEGDARPQGTACDFGADEFRAGQ
jgi:hypothetical protein